MSISGWKLDPGDRDMLLSRAPPRYPNVVADHVTLDTDGPEALPGPVSARVVGMSDDDEGVQALVVAIGETTARPGGGTYHITWSLDRRQAVESNDVIAQYGWRPLGPIPIRLIPAWVD